MKYLFLDLDAHVWTFTDKLEKRMKKDILNGNGVAIDLNTKEEISSVNGDKLHRRPCDINIDN